MNFCTVYCRALLLSSFLLWQVAGDCKIEGVSYGNLGTIKKGKSHWTSRDVHEWAPLLGVACADSLSGPCYSDAIIWSEVAIQHGNQSIDSEGECKDLCTKTKGCDVWTYWPDGVGIKIPLATIAQTGCDVCPASAGYMVDREREYCTGGICKKCGKIYDEIYERLEEGENTLGDIKAQCSDFMRSFVMEKGCCRIIEGTEEKSTGACELFAASPENDHVLSFMQGSHVTSPKTCDETVWLPFLESTKLSVDDKTEISNNENRCWVSGHSYGIAEDGACDDAEIILVYAPNFVLELGKTQGWWKGKPANLVSIQEGTFSASKCKEKCITNHNCGGWEFQNDESCILKSKLDCSPTLARSTTFDSVAGVKGCVNPDSNITVEQNALDTSDLWYLNCDQPRCTKPHSDGSWAEDTFIPDYEADNACWYKHFTPEELYNDCAQDRWIVISGGSNTLSFFTQMVGLFAPQRNNVSSPFVGFGETFAYSIIDIVFKKNSMPILSKNDDGILYQNMKMFCQIDPSINLTCAGSLVFQNGTAEWSDEIANLTGQALANVPYEPGSTRITLVAGQIWSHAAVVLDSIRNIRRSGADWANTNVIFYGQAMVWYPCYVEKWCEDESLGSTNEKMIKKYRSDLVDLLEVGEKTCATSDYDCFFATHAYGGSVGTRSREMIDTLDELTSQYNWSHFIDYNGIVDTDEIVKGHLTASMIQPVQTMIWNTVCNGPSRGCPEAISMTPTCWADCRGRGGGDSCGSCLEDNWVCMNERQCDYEVLNPIPWRVAVEAPPISKEFNYTCNNRSLWGIPYEHNTSSFAYVEIAEESCNRIWCGSAFDGWIFGIIFFTVGTLAILIPNFFHLCNNSESKREKTTPENSSPRYDMRELVQKENTSFSNIYQARSPKLSDDDESVDPDESSTEMDPDDFLNEEGQILHSKLSAYTNKSNRSIASHKSIKSGGSFESARSQNSYKSERSQLSGNLSNNSKLYTPTRKSSYRNSYKNYDTPNTAVTDEIDVDEIDVDSFTSNIEISFTESYPTSSPNGSPRRLTTLREAKVEIEVVNTEDAPTKKEYLKSIGIARLIASQHIVLGHLLAKEATDDIYFFGWGYTWVPWFFVLSGYVLTHARLNSSDPSNVDDPLSHVAKRLSTIFPTYAIGLLLTLILRIIRGLKLPSYGTLFGQSFLLQSWNPFWTEDAFLSQCWFLSNLILYWFVFGWTYRSIRCMTLIQTVVSLGVISLIPWLTIIIPASVDDVEFNWYNQHNWGETDTATDIWTIILKFNPVAYFHIFLFGMVLAVLRNRLKTEKDSDLAKILTFFTQYGAMIGYFGLVLIFTIEAIKPISYKLSARLSVLLPIQGIIMLGLSPLPRIIENGDFYDPLARLFSYAPSWVGDMSYCQYVLQFIMYNLFPVANITNLSFFLSLWGASLLFYKLIQEPAAKCWREFLLIKKEKESNVIKCRALVVILFPSFVLTVLLSIAKFSYDSQPKAIHAQRNYTALPPLVRIDEEAVDMALNWVMEGDVEKLVPINPSMLFFENDEGELDLIRALRAHHVTEKTKYGLNRNTEHIVTFESSIMLSQERFSGNLSLGFDDESIKGWGLDGKETLKHKDYSIISHKQKGKGWTDLCEPAGRYDEVQEWFARKIVTGPEDPKLFEVPAIGDGGTKAWSLTFSSYPPAALIEESSSANDCKWSKKAVMQMYLAADGPTLASGEETQAVRVDCGKSDGDEKNWIAFYHRANLYYIHSIEPHIVVHVRKSDGACVEQYKTSSMYLRKTTLQFRGSATATRYSNTEYLALMHTKDPVKGYTTIAYTFQSEPPFAIQRISKTLPLHSRAFASSLIVHEGKILIAYGEADEKSRILVMSRDHLDTLFDQC